MVMETIINKLPEVIKCIIFDYVSYYLNYEIELISDKFIGNPIDLFDDDIYDTTGYGTINFYHVNKLSKIKTFLHVIGLNYFLGKYCDNPPQEIFNKLQKFSIICSTHYLVNLPKLPNIKILNIIRKSKISIFNGLLELKLYKCNLTKIPHIIGLKKLKCDDCPKLTKIPHIVGLLELYCHHCPKLIEIPHIIGLLELDCHRCYKLTEIPHIIGLKKCYT